MIDTFGLLVSHGLIVIAVWRLMWRADLNDDAAAPPPVQESPFRRWGDRKGA